MRFGQTREKIVSAARALVRAGGPGYATMRRIGSAVGIVPSAIYRHFDCKEHLLDECARRESVLIGQQVDALRKKPKRGFVRCVRIWLELARTSPHVFKLLRDRATAPSPPYEALGGPILRLLERQHRGADRETRTLIAKQVWAAVVGGAALHEAGQLASKRELTHFTLENVNSMTRGFAPLIISPPGYRFCWGHFFEATEVSPKA